MVLCGIVSGGEGDTGGNRTEKGKNVAKKPWVEKDQCISCGICKNNCPEVFRFDAHGKSECYNPDGAPEEVIQTMAIDLCPVSCIIWMEEV
jgi:ferredoxin